MMNEGVYWGAAIAYQSARTKNGSPQVVITWKITHEQNGEEWADLPAPVERRSYWSLAGGAFDITCDRLKRLDWNGVFDANMAITAEGQELYMKMETYNGKSKERWDLSAGQQELDPLDPAAIRQLNAQYAAKQRAAGKTAKPPSKRSVGTPADAPTGPTPPDDGSPPVDDIPF